MRNKVTKLLAGVMLCGALLPSVALAAEITNEKNVEIPVVDIVLYSDDPEITDPI